jgi:hypothetical protein
MTKLIQDSEKLSELLEMFDISADNLDHVIIKVRRENKQLIDAGDCYIIKCDRNGSEKEN